MPTTAPPQPGKMVVDYTVTLSDEDAAKMDAIAARARMTPEAYMAVAIKQFVIQERQPIRKLLV
jgi:predicted transcriptional regulator